MSWEAPHTNIEEHQRMWLVFFKGKGCFDVKKPHTNIEEHQRMFMTS
jgi:hypothetical protein